MKAIKRAQCLLEWRTSIGSMQIEYVNTIGPELAQRFLQHLFKDVGAMCTALVDFVGISIVRIPLGSAREPSSFPSSFAGEAFLLAANVDASSVDLRVSSALKTIQDLVVGGQRCDAGSFRLVGSTIELDQDVSGSFSPCWTYNVIVPKMTRGFLTPFSMRDAILLNKTWLSRFPNVHSPSLYGSVFGQEPWRDLLFRKVRRPTNPHGFVQ